MGYGDAVSSSCQTSIWGGAHTITNNDPIKDNAHFATAILRMGPNAQINDDLLVNSFSIEMSSGPSVGGDLVGMSYQTLVAGQVGEGAVKSSNADAIRGTISEGLEASVGGQQRPARLHKIS